MDVVISARHTEVSDSVHEYATDKIGRLDRFLNGMERAEVHFDEFHNPRIQDREQVEVTMAGHGHHVRCKVNAPDKFAAVDLAVDKLEHQLHKLKTRLVRRSQPNPHAPVHSSESASELVESAHGEEPDDGPRIVKTKRFAMQPMTPDEAAIQMEFMDHGFFFFTNELTGHAAVVYRRDDGDVGLIDEAG